MKILPTIFLLLFSLILKAQDKVAGVYRDNFGSRLEFNADNTFKYVHHFDVMVSWTNGIWVLKNDTIFLQMVPTYDTLSQVKDKVAIDTLILSFNEIPRRITQQQRNSDLGILGGQNYYGWPNKLLYKKGRLYTFRNGQLVVKKQRPFGSGKKFVPWLFKAED